LRARTVLLENALSDVKGTAETIVAEVGRWEETIIRAADAIRMNPSVRAMDPRAHADAFAGGFAALDDYVYTMYSIDGEGTQFVLRDGSRGSGFRGDRTYFVEAMAGRSVSRQVLMGRSLDPPAPAVAYGFPIPRLNDNSSTEGVLLVASTLSELGRIIGANSLGEAGTIFIVDETARLIAHPDASLVEGDELVDYSSHPAVASLLSGRNEDEFFRYDTAGHSLISHYVDIGNGWTAFVEIDERFVTMQARAFTTIGLIVSALGLVALVVALGVTTTVMLKPLAHLGELFNGFAGGGGDLSTRLSIDRRDEIGRVSTSFNAFLDDLSGRIVGVQGLGAHLDDGVESVGTIVAALQTVCETLSDYFANWISLNEEVVRESGESERGSDEIRGLVGEVDELIVAQSAALEESSSATNEMSAALSNLARVSAEKLKQTRSVEESGKAGEALIQNALKSIRDLSGSAEVINEMTDIINSIAAQTNLLAMNAAIEASHAGEAGKGFAVVAGEIRKLAETTSESSKKISSSVGKMIADIETGRENTEVAGEHFVSLVRSIVEVGDAFSEITDTVREIDQGSNEIADALVVIVEKAERIKESSNQVRRDIGAISQSMQRLTKASQESSARTQSIHEYFDLLEKQIEGLNNESVRYEEATRALTLQLGGFHTNEEQKNTA
ncbi:MAG: methyl-accepting chemotaxis protein, partial [Spirochaetales bacterium]|nr:methyl-accepting chemotaxis protein [Spirochaetales bacterium]